MISDFIKKKTEQTDGWVLAESKEDGLPVLFRCRSSIPFAVQEKDYPFLINVYWRYIPGNESGMPDNGTNNLQVEFEKALFPIDERKYGFNMFTVTGNSRKEWIWYVKDVNSWLSALSGCLASYPKFPIEIQKENDPTWNTYKSFVKGINGI